MIVYAAFRKVKTDREKKKAAQAARAEGQNPPSQQQYPPHYQHSQAQGQQQFV